MKKIIAIISGVVLAAALSTSAFAQAAGPANGGVQKPTQGVGSQGKQHKARAPIGKKILKELNLTPDQQKQVKALIAKYVKAHEAETTTTSRPNKKQIAADRKQFMEDFNKILTPDQQQKLKDLIAKAKEGKKGGKTPPGTTSGGGTTTGGGATTGGGSGGGH